MNKPHLRYACLPSLLATILLIPLLPAIAADGATKKPNILVI